MYITTGCYIPVADKVRNQFGITKSHRHCEKPSSRQTYLALDSKQHHYGLWQLNANNYYSYSHQLTSNLFQNGICSWNLLDKLLINCSSIVRIPFPIILLTENLAGRSNYTNVLPSKQKYFEKKKNNKLW